MSEPGASDGGARAAADDGSADLPSSLAHRPPSTVIIVEVRPAEFGIPIEDVREVLRTPIISRVPFPPFAVCGAVALRGSVIPVLDLGRRLFDRPAARPGGLVVVQPQQFSGRVALLVDSIVGLLEAAAAEVHDPPAEGAATLPAGWVTSVLLPQPERPITVLNLAPVLGGDAVAAASDEPFFASDDGHG